MKTNRLFLIMLPVLAAVMLATIRCGNATEPEPVNNIIPTTPFEYQSYGCDAFFNPHDWYADTIIVINNRENFLKNFICYEYPFDFSAKTLLLAYGSSPSTLTNTTYSLIKNDNVYTLNVKLRMTDNDAIDFWAIAITVDKINVSDNIILNAYRYEN